MDEHCIYLAVGSNIDPETNLPLAVETLSKLVKVEKLSSVWETPAVGLSGPNFLNMAVQIRSKLSPIALKFLVLRNIEAQLGRKRTQNKYEPRTIDIDIVIADSVIVDDQVWQLAHLAIPLAELIPEIINEVRGETLKQAALRFSQTQSVFRRTDLLFQPH